MKTIVFDAAANDNGLFHEEVVDYDAPGGWPELPRASPTLNDAATCLRPFRNGEAFPAPEDLESYWNATGKFQLRDPLGDGAPRPCAVAPLPADCSTKGQGRQKKRGCYLACEDHASQAFAAIAMTSTLNASSHVVRHGALPPGVGWVFENVTR